MNKPSIIFKHICIVYYIALRIEEIAIPFN